MSEPQLATIKTFVKYMAWTAAAAAIQYVTNAYTTFGFPDWAVPILGAALKAAATYVATKTKV